MFFCRVKPGDSAGLNILCSIDTQVFEPSWNLNQWIAEVENHANNVYLIYLDQELFFPAGLLTYGYVGEAIELKKIGVLGEFRRKHIADEAMQYMIEDGRANKMHNIIIEVAVINTAAIRLYEKFGFYKINTRKKYYGNLVDAYVMQKEL